MNRYFFIEKERATLSGIEIEVDYGRIHSELEKKITCGMLCSVYGPRGGAGAGLPIAVGKDSFALFSALRDEASDRLMAHLSAWTNYVDVTEASIRICLDVDAPAATVTAMNRRASQYVMHCICSGLLAAEYPQAAQRASERAVSAMGSIHTMLARLERSARQKA